MRTLESLIVFNVLTQDKLIPFFRPMEIVQSLDEIHEVQIIAWEMGLVLGENGKFQQHKIRSSHPWALPLDMPWGVW